MKELDIRRWARPISCERGKEIYEDGRILSFDLKVLENGTEAISANVKGSGNNIYLAEIELDTKDNMIKDYYCECPAYDEYLSLCEHCVAALLKFIDVKEMEQGQKAKEYSKTVQKLKEVKGTRHTPPAVREILQKRMQMLALPILQKNIHGKVHLTPYLTEGYRMSLEFKIGVERNYIVKNILEFAECMENQKSFEYGKHLEFVHTRDAFDEESKPLLDFILLWVKKYRSRNTRRYLGGVYYTGAANLRKMELDEFDLEAFLCAMGSNTFEFTDYQNVKKICQTVNTPLPHTMTITGMDSGIEVSLSENNGYRGVRYYISYRDGIFYLDPVERYTAIEDFLDFMKSSKLHQVYIDKEDAPVFCRELLPKIEEVYTCEKKSFDVSNYNAIPAEYEFYLDAPNKDLILCRAEVVYGEKRFSVFDENKSGMRDLVGESLVKELVSHYSNAFDKREMSMALAGDEELLYELLTEGIQAFGRYGKVYVSDAIKKFEIRENPHVTLGVSLSGDMLELNVSSGDMSKAELIEILSGYHRKKKYYRLKNGDFVRIEEDGIEILQEIRKDLNLTISQLKEKNIRLPKYRALYLEEKGLVRKGQSFAFERDTKFVSLINRMGDSRNFDKAVPKSLVKVLRPYQKEGFVWLKTLCHNGFGGILADDMGLGKTLQVLAFLLSEVQTASDSENRRTLIVAPASLVFNWRNEILRFAPELSVCTVTGKAEERHCIIRESGERDILLTSYDLLRRDEKVYVELSFFCEVIDEAQYIKNHNTKAAHAVKKVNASFRVALTGTPVENRLSELWSIFDYLMPGFLYGYKRFREEFEIPVVQNGQESALRRLQKLIGPFVLRRLKREVLKDLPDKLEENVYAPLSGEQEKLYKAHVGRIKLMLDGASEEEFQTSKIEILSELTRLRQLCCNPELVYDNYKGNAEKIDMCLELVEDAVQGGHKILLFSQFTSMLQILQNRLEERDISYYSLTGSTGKEKRLELVEKFNTDDTSVFCISLKAGGTGLNLTAADVVIHYDPWWNLAVQNQATDRAHRIGQKNVVTVFKLVMKDTIEENIIRLQEKKKELAEQLLGGEEVSRAAFSKEELLELLG